MADTGQICNLCHQRHVNVLVNGYDWRNENILNQWNKDYRTLLFMWNSKIIFIGQFTESAVVTTKMTLALHMYRYKFQNNSSIWNMQLISPVENIWVWIHKWLCNLTWLLWNTPLCHGGGFVQLLTLCKVRVCVLYCLSKFTVHFHWERVEFSFFLKQLIHIYLKILSYSSF